MPRATYRLQLHGGFPFAERRRAGALPGGARHQPPLLLAVPARAAGQPARLRHRRPRRAQPRARQRATTSTGSSSALHAHGMGLLLDVVPNHMGVLGGDNAWWLDVLENGPASAYADYFDIDWAAADPALRGKVLLPILGDQYGVVLERGELRLRFDAGARRFDARLLRAPPAGRPGSVRPAAGARDARDCRRGRRAPRGGADAGDAPRRSLPSHDAASVAAAPARRDERRRCKLAPGRAGAAVGPRCASASSASRELNGRAGERASFDALDALIDAQAYRLAHWRVAADEINYRRFFDINELAALRMERERGLRGHAPAACSSWPPTARSTACASTIPTAWSTRPATSGGCSSATPSCPAAPRRAARRRRRATAALRGGREDRRAARAAAARLGGARHHRLPLRQRRQRPDDRRRAAKRGSTASGARSCATRPQDFDTLAWHCRHVVMDGTLAGELTVLAERAAAPRARRPAHARLHAQLAAPGARRGGRGVPGLPHLHRRRAERAGPPLHRLGDRPGAPAQPRPADASVFDFLRRVLLGRPLPGAPGGLARALPRVRAAPAAVHRAGGGQGHRGHRALPPPPAGLGQRRRRRPRRVRHVGGRLPRREPRPRAALAAHDAGHLDPRRQALGGRARCASTCISEMPAAWRLAVRRWSRHEPQPQAHRRRRAARRRATTNTCSTRCWSAACRPARSTTRRSPPTRARIEQVMLKSAREAKAVTSWMNPNAAYEAALVGLRAGAARPRRDSNLFLDDLQTQRRGARLVRRAERPDDGARQEPVAGGARLLPGPRGDRAVAGRPRQPARRSTSHGAARCSTRRSAIAALPDRAAPRCARCWRRRSTGGPSSGSPGARCSCAARTRPCCGAPTTCRSRCAASARAHVVAFARRDGPRWLVVVATRLSASLRPGVGEAPSATRWGDTAIVWPERRELARPAWLADVIAAGAMPLRDGVLPLAELLREFPVAALFGRRCRDRP